MKHIQTILFAFISMIFSSCNKGGLVNETNSDTYFYSSDKSKIFYKHSSSPDVSKLWNFEWLEVPANAKTFEVMKGGLGKDDKNIFSGRAIIDFVDYNSFKVLDNKNYIDNKNVYTRSLKIIDNANPNTYRVIKSTEDYYDESVYPWAKDDKHFFYKDKPVDVDYNSFKIITPFIMVDNNYFHCLYFGNFVKIPNENGTSEGFKVLSNDKVFNSKILYYKHLEKDTEKPFSEIPIKDSNSIRKFGYGSYFTVDDVVYYGMMKIENADPNSFEIFIKGWAEYFAKDKNNFYVRKKIVANVNPDEVIYNLEKDEFSYRGKYWNYETEKFDKETKK